MEYVLVAVDLKYIQECLGNDPNKNSIGYVCHSIAKVYQRHWGLEATVAGSDLVFGGGSFRGLDLPTPIFSKVNLAEGYSETIRMRTLFSDDFHAASVDITSGNGLVLIKFK